MSEQAYRELSADILRHAVFDFTCGAPGRRRDASIFLCSSWAKFLFEALEIDWDTALETVQNNRRQYNSYVMRARVGDENAKPEFANWWRRHFVQYHVPAI